MINSDHQSPIASSGRATPHIESLWLTLLAMPPCPRSRSYVPIATGANERL